jgi:hypothetical protein
MLIPLYGITFASQIVYYYVSMYVIELIELCFCISYLVINYTLKPYLKIIKQSHALSLLIWQQRVKLNLQVLISPLSRSTRALSHKS